MEQNFKIKEIIDGTLAVILKSVKDLLKLDFRNIYYNFKLLILSFTKSYFNFPEENKAKLYDFIWSYSNIRSFAASMTEIFVLEIYSPSKILINKENPIIFDVGAYIGDSTLYFKKIFPKSKIYAFEPIEKYFKLLKKNIKENNLKDIEIFNFGLGKEEKEIEIVEEETITSTKIEGKKEKIKIRPINEFLKKEKNIDLLKIDIEGYEYELFENIDLSNVKNVIMELHYYFETNKRTISKILEKLEKESFYYIIYANNLCYFTKESFTYTLLASKDKEKIIELMKKRNIFSKVW